MNRKISGSHRKNRIREKIGQPPGSLIYVGESNLSSCTIIITEYDETSVETRQIKTLDELKNLNLSRKTWVSIHGLQNTDLLAEAGNIFGIHPLTLEDILNNYQRPKIDYYGDYLFAVFQKITASENNGLRYDQTSMVLKQNLLITFHDEAPEGLKPVYERINSGKGIIRDSGVDYLFYVNLDLIIDNFFLAIEVIGEMIEQLQDELLFEPSQENVLKIQSLKKELHKFRHATMPVREILNSLLRRESSLINPSTEVYLKDLLDHQVQIMETIEMQRESIITLLDIYLSSISNKMNEVMKVLTIIATIFIPLTFIAGLYGMNFEGMPELRWRYGYPLVLAIMAVIGLLLVIYFRRKKWM